jgi:hypothetical protein
LLGAGIWTQPASANDLGAPEGAVLSAFNICWTAEDGGDHERLAAQKGFVRAPQAKGPMYHRDVQGSVVFLTADFAPGADGAPEPACRVTELDTPYTLRHAILPAGNALIHRMVQDSAKLGWGYRTMLLRQPHPRRAGLKRTLLRSDQQQRARMIYIEESAAYYEFLYVHASRAVIDDPATADIGTDPKGRAGMQAFVNDRWEIAFCNLNPHACVTPEQQRRMDSAAAARARDSSSWTAPFSGIGSRGGGDNRSNEQRLRDEAWWKNYHQCGRGRC